MNTPLQRLPSAPPPNVGSRDELTELIEILLHAKWGILLTAAVVAMLAGGVALYLKPIYRAEAVVALASDSSGGGGLAALAGQFEGLAGFAGINVKSGGGSEAMGILRSRALAERFMTTAGIVPVLARESGLRSADSQQSGRDASDEVEMSEAYRVFDERVRSVSEDPDTGLVRMQIEWSDRRAAAEWANAFIAMANQVIRERSIDQSQKRLDYLSEEVSKTGSLELREAMYRLIDSEVKSKMLASIDPEIAFRIVDPAVPPALADVARPKAPLVAGVGFMAGLFLAVIFAYIRGVYRHRRELSA